MRRCNPARTLKMCSIFDGWFHPEAWLLEIGLNFWHQMLQDQQRTHTVEKLGFKEPVSFPLQGRKQLHLHGSVKWGDPVDQLRYLVSKLWVCISPFPRLTLSYYNLWPWHELSWFRIKIDLQVKEKGGWENSTEMISLSTQQPFTVRPACGNYLLFL